MLRQDITSSLLCSHYPVVQSLASYLVNILDIEDAAGEDEGRRSGLMTMVDSPTFLDFMTTTMVAAKEKGQRRFKMFPPMCEMKEVVAEAQRRFLRSAPKGPSILTSGYYLNGGILTKNGRNLVVSVFENSEWKQLLQRIGVDPMLNLLVDTSLFVALPNYCLYQVTGDPIVAVEVLSDLKPAPMGLLSATKRPVPVSFTNSGTLPHKRRKLRKNGRVINVGEGSSLKEVSPQDINITRSRLFFSRPCHVPETNIVAVGLPSRHVLNCIHPSWTKNSELPHHSQDPIKQANDVRHLSKYLFPRQYGMQTPFQYIGKLKETYMSICLDREQDIKILGRCKTPKRIRDVLPLIDKLIWRHKKCNYKALRDVACPTKIKDQGKLLQENVILELMSEQSIQLATQPSLHLDDISLDSDGNAILPLGSTQAMKHAQGKPKFTEFECSHHQVLRYAALVTNAVIPKSFWGSKHNYTLVLHNVKRFIECRRYETFSLHHLMQGFSTSACEWLMPPGKKAKAQGRVCVSDSLKRHELLVEFMFWYFDGFLLPLLRTTFYITESSAFRNRILYFRQDDWQTLCSPLMKRLVETMFIKIPQLEAEELLKQRKLGYSFVRLLPKDTGVRPIVNLRGSKTSQPVYGAPKRSINMILRAAFDILTYERTTRGYLLGASIIGPDQVYVRLKNFKNSLRRSNGELPKLYFVKVDVQACFDTIEQTKLLEILRDLLSEDEYGIHRYGQAQYSAGKPKHFFKRKAGPQEEDAHFLKYASDLASELWNTVFVGLPLGKSSSSEKKEVILELLEEHITDNMVKIDGQYYRQKVGIPQGSILSTILCSFFYGDLERHNERYKHLRTAPGNVLFRLVDDYLFVTTSRHHATLFLDMMNEGHPEYGCFIGKDKTLTNLDYDAQIMNVVEPSSKNFSWCGYLINMRDLSVTVDYSRYATWGISNTLTVDKGRKPGATFLRKMLLLSRTKCHVIYTDAILNPEIVVYLNIYQNMLLAAMKMQEYIRDAKLLRGKATFIYKSINKVVHAAYASIQQQVTRKAKLNDGKNIPCDIKKSAALWLGFHAFHHVFSRKPGGYRSMIPLLEKELHRVQSRGYKRRFKHLVIEGQSAFDFGSGAV